MIRVALCTIVGRDDCNFIYSIKRDNTRLFSSVLSFCSFVFLQGTMLTMENGITGIIISFESVLYSALLTIIDARTYIEKELKATNNFA